MILTVMLFVFGHYTLATEILRSQHRDLRDVDFVVYGVKAFAFPPTTNNSISVLENIANHSIIGWVAINNSDDHPKLSYHLQPSGSQTMVPFLVTPRGLIYTSGFLDRESMPKYSFKVEALDNVTQSGATITVYINVEDENDNAPDFEIGTYDVNIAENAVVGSYCIRVMAADRDSGDNARISYKVLNGGDLFGIDGTTGKIYTRRPLDRETMERHQLTVLASDHGIPSYSGTAKVLVRKQI